MSHTEADQPGQSPQPEAVGERLAAVETEQKRQGGIVEQISGAVERIEQVLSGRKAPASRQDLDDEAMAEYMHRGIAKLRAADEAKAAEDAKKAQQDDVAARVAALEERKPSEVAATPAGRIRGGVQRWFFGVDQPRK